MKTKLLLMMTLLLVGLMPARAQGSVVTIDGLTYKIENGEAALVWGPTCQENDIGIPKVVIPEKVVGCNVTTLNFNPYCDTLVIPKTVTTIDPMVTYNGMDNPNFEGVTWYGANFIDCKVENPGTKFDIYKMTSATAAFDSWYDGNDANWLKVPVGYEQNYPAINPQYSYPIMIYSEEIVDNGVIYRVNWGDMTAIIAGYTNEFPTGAGVTFNVPTQCISYGITFDIVGINVIPNVETLILPEDPSHTMKFLRDKGPNSSPALKSLIIPEGLQNLYSHRFLSSKTLERFVFTPNMELGFASEVHADEVWFYGTFEQFEHLIYADTYIGVQADVYYVPSSEVSNFQEAFVGIENLENNVEVRLIPSDQASIDSWTNGLTFGTCSYHDYEGEGGYVEGAMVTGYHGTMPENLLIPSWYNGHRVVRIDDGAFMNNTDIKSVTLSKSMREIGTSVFQGCTNLERVEINTEIVGSHVDLITIGTSAFEGCTALKEVASPYMGTTATFSSRAFYNTSSLSSMELAVYKTIGPEAFAYSGIKRLPLQYPPDELLEIGARAFKGSKIEECYDDVTVIIGESAFEDCSMLTRVFLCGYPDEEGNIKLQIGDKAFYNCSQLGQVGISHNPQSIGNQAFGYCSKLKYIDLNPTPDATYTTALGNNIFNYCSQLQTITFPKKVSLPASGRIIGAYPLNSLEVVNLPLSWSGVAEFGGTPPTVSLISPAINPSQLNNFSFDLDTYQNATVIVPKGTLATYQAADGWKLFYNLAENGDVAPKVYVNDVEYTLNMENNTAKVTGYKEQELYIQHHSEMTYDEDGNINLNEWYETIYNTHETITLETSITWAGETYQVNEIADEAFKNSHILKKLTIPQNYTVIGSNVFTGSSLEEVVLNCPLQDYSTTTWYYNETTTNGPFYGCEKLVKATVGEGTCTILPASLFSGASALKEVTLPSNLKWILNYSFAGTGLESIQLPASIEELGQSAFENSQLKSISLNEGIKYIGYDCFNGTPIEEIYLPSTIDYSFSSNNLSAILRGMQNLRKVVCAENETLTEVPSMSFYYKDKLEEIVLPSTVKSIGDYAFNDCTSLKGIELSEGLESIGDYAFQGCTSLEDVNLPSTLKTIGQYAFSMTKLKSLILPESLESVGWYAFWNNVNPSNGYYQNYDHVVSFAATPPSRNVFTIIKDNSTSLTMPPLYVPVGSKAVYEAEWGAEFTDIWEFPGEEFLIYGEEKTSARGATVKVPVEMFNISEVAGVMFDVTLPEGVELAKNSNGNYIVTLGGRTTDHQLIVNKLSNGDYRFIVVSLTSEPITSYDGDLLTMSLNVATTATAGDFELLFHDTQLVAYSGTTVSGITPSDGTSPFTILSDIVGNIDGSADGITLLDVIKLLRHINRIEEISPLNMAVTDVIADGVIDLLDALQLLDILSKQSNANTGTFDGYGLVEATPGDDGINVSLSSEPCTALTMDVTLPDGITLDGVTLDASRCADHAAQITALSGGHYRVIVWSATSADLKGTSGRLLHLKTSMTPTTVNIDGIGIGTNNLRLLSALPVDGYATGIRSLSSGLGIRTEGSTILVTAAHDARVTVVSTDGRLVRQMEVRRGTSRHQGFAPGVYLVNGERVIIK